MSPQCHQSQRCYRSGSVVNGCHKNDAGATGFVFMLLNVQRLRDMGYRYPVVVSLLLIIFSQVSDFLDNLVKMNFISLFIDMGLLVFFIKMLFTESKKQTAY